MMRKPKQVGTSQAADALQRAAAALQNRRPDEAERIAAEVLAKEPQHPGASHLLGVALVEQGRPREAIAPLEEAARRRSDAVVETHLAMALRQVGRSAQAIATLERA